MKSLVAAIGAWALSCLGLMLLVPGGGTLLPCMRLVGRSTGCEAQQDALNQAYAATHWYPILGFMLVGLLVVAAAALVSYRRRQRL